MRLSKFASALAFAMLLLCGCNSDSVSRLAVPLAPSAPQLPVSPAFTVTSVATPAPSAGATTMTVPLPPSTGYSGKAMFPVASVPPKLVITITYSDRPPAGVAPFAAMRQTPSGQRAVLDALNTDVAYACFTANYRVTIDQAPQFSFALPPGFATSSVVYNLAIAQNGQWTNGYGGPGTFIASGSSATVSVAGRFGFTIPADGVVCVALYGRLTSAPTPVPATPAPIASALPVPNASPTPMPSVSASPVPSGSPSVSPLPPPSHIPNPTPTPSPMPTSVASLNETFAGTSTAPNGWVHGGQACLTAGTATTPASSIPACSGASDVSGSGTLQLTADAVNAIGFAVSTTAIAVSSNVTVGFDYFAYNGAAAGDGADGLSFFLLDASHPLPTVPGGVGAGLGYANANSTAGIANAYLGIGLDSRGNFSVSGLGPSGGTPRRVAETIAIRGAASTNYAYIGGYKSGLSAASLPFSLDSSGGNSRSVAVHVQVQIDSVHRSVSVSIGGTTYISAMSFMVAGQPVFPARCYFGFAASTGSLTDVHQIRNFVIATM